MTPPSSLIGEQREDEEKRDTYLRQVQSNDLMAYGMIPEFIGRLPIVVSLTSLNEDMLVDILTKPQNSLVSQYNVLFNMDGVCVFYIFLMKYHTCSVVKVSKNLELAHKNLYTLHVHVCHIVNDNTTLLTENI